MVLFREFLLYQKKFKDVGIIIQYAFISCTCIGDEMKLVILKLMNQVRT